MTAAQTRISSDDLTEMASLKNWGQQPPEHEKELASKAVVDCGWGRLIFGQTFEDGACLANALQEEEPGRRDVALYVREPHVVLSHAPQALFLDPSHTFRLDLTKWAPAPTETTGFSVRPGRGEDEGAINAIYMAHGMVPVTEGYIGTRPEPVTVLVAEDAETADVIGVVMGVDHVVAFADPDNGSSLWSLAVDAQAKHAGIGAALVVTLAQLFKDRGRAFMDLSVMHDNEMAIALYTKLGFVQVPIYAVKKKNPINEKLFIGPAPENKFNIYAQIVIDEARRRGIAVEVEDVAAGLFKLYVGGRSISCRESLSDLTSAVAMSRCDDKSLTHRLLAHAGLNVPDQQVVASCEEALAFLQRHSRVVVKPQRGEQGHGVAVDLRSRENVQEAVEQALEICDQAVMEEFVAGQDLRIIVIDGEAVAAAVRRPASIIGDGRHTIAELIEKQSRRREAATQGESRIPVDPETRRCVLQAGHGMEDVLTAGDELAVRKTANLHTGGTIHDCTADLNPDLAEAAVKAAHVLDIPVVGLDMIVPSPKGNIYHIIEANERPGLANHEPAPTAEKFIDFLFPQTKGAIRGAATPGA